MAYFKPVEMYYICALYFQQQTMHKPHIFCTNCISVPEHYQVQHSVINFP
ncbi:hypothetical protein BACCAP_01628 [Pseudoflavonifractor capillosus ATCC 29799]|uniref:Uncharacterized protein n=1 Tax=Pseudoflavonifractor capillosus ATCC 29799 TaxID=411467 RepID=A6NTU9_9FIRM|nr:hypothetical protein BACCAP_01628 [Pseudoflavonifractor capillosus ATCC 29799]